MTAVSQQLVLWNTGSWLR